MLRKAVLATTLTLGVASLAYAAVMTPVGNWQGSLSAAGTDLPSRFSFTVQGDSMLLGSMHLVEHSVDFEITGGRVRGDSVFFSVDFAGMATMAARGKVAGDSLHLAADFGGGTEAAATYTRMP